MKDYKCPKCGNPVEKDIRYCASCNEDLYAMWQDEHYDSLDRRYTYTEPTERSVWLSKSESFFLPPYGFLLYLTLKNEDRPQKAKIVLNSALKGVGFYAAVAAAIVIVGFLL